MPRLPDRPLVAALLAIGLGAALSAAASNDDPASAGSGAPPGDTGTASTAAAPASGATTTSAGAAPAASSGTYADGTYEASGSYQSPAGKETVSVSLTVAGDRVTAVDVTPGASGGPSKQFQDQFVGGIGQVVVGRPLSSLRVDAVAGSSLTGEGFNEAAERIRQEAGA
ncbi:FMN-binding protein [Patulibacter minatonensis]|uniref:FMN-binding protein n=1 Tax=Patulibacter minatonensis TaxID=298163 RepID=UPI00047EDF6F|nr:FMN-binding protein [Patulibacter minatonensis]